MGLLSSDTRITKVMTQLIHATFTPDSQHVSAFVELPSTAEHLLYDEAHENKPLNITDTVDLVNTVCHDLVFMTVWETSFTQNRTMTKVIAFFFCVQIHTEITLLGTPVQHNAALTDQLSSVPAHSCVSLRTDAAIHFVTHLLFSCHVWLNHCGMCHYSDVYGGLALTFITWEVHKGDQTRKYENTK